MADIITGLLQNGSILPLNDQQRTLLESRIREFVKDNLAKINKLHLSDIAINPYLIATMNLHAPEEVVDFIVTQRIQRSVVTSFGSLLEKKIAGFFGEPAGIKDVDLKFEREGKTCYVQLKSGPEGFTGPALEKTLVSMENLKKRNPSCRTVVAFSSGTRQKLSKVWGPELLRAESGGKVEVMVGREFWKFVLNDKNGYKILFDIFNKAGVVNDSTISGETQTLEEARRDAYNRILEEFKAKYGESGIVDKLIEDNL